MKNLFFIGLVVVVLMGANCGDPKNDSPVSDDCVTALTGGDVNNLVGTWKVGPDESSFSDQIFTINSPIDGTGECIGDGPCHNGSPEPGEIVLWSISGNVLTLKWGKWFGDFFSVIHISTYYWEIKNDTPNALVLQHVKNNICSNPFSSTRQ